MQLELTTWQRIMCAQIVGELKGTARQVWLAGLLLENLEFSEAEALQIHLKALPGGQLKWDPEAPPWTLDLPEKAIKELLVPAVRDFQGWPAAGYREVAGLLARLGLSLEDSDVTPPANSRR